MLEHLEYLLDGDTRSRWRILTTSALAVAAIGAALEITGLPVRNAQIVATSVGIGVFLAQVLEYCLRRKRREAGRRPWQERAMSLIPRRVATAAIAAGVILSWILPRDGKRMPRSSTEVFGCHRVAPPLSPEHAQTIAYSLHAATLGQVVLSPETLRKVRDAIRASAIQNPVSTSLPQAATALVRYAREGPVPTIRAMGKHAQAEAQAALDAGGRMMPDQITAIPRGFNLAKVKEALPFFTKAIELTDGDTRLLARAYYYRATAENLLGAHKEALDDIRTAEKLGALDLAELFPAEAGALLGLGQAEDLPLAVDLLTFALQLPPPEQTAPDPRDEGLYRIGVSQMRAEAYKRLARFEEAIKDYRTALGFLPSPSTGAAVIYLYKGLILTCLESGSLETGSLDKALAVSQEFVQRTNGYPLASDTLNLLLVYRSIGPYEKGWPDPERLIAAINGLWRKEGFRS